MLSRLIESGIIGLFAGGWASCTYWQGGAGIFIGIVIGLTSLFFLTIQREQESTENRTRHVRSESPYKKCA